MLFRLWVVWFAYLLSHAFRDAWREGFAYFEKAWNLYELIFFAVCLYNFHGMNIFWKLSIEELARYSNEPALIHGDEFRDLHNYVKAFTYLRRSTGMLMYMATLYAMS